MVGANGPVRGPHPVRASGKSVKDDSSPVVRGPRPMRVREQESIGYEIILKLMSTQKYPREFWWRA